MWEYLPGKRRTQKAKKKQCLLTGGFSTSRFQHEYYIRAGTNHSQTGKDFKTKNGPDTLLRLSPIPARSWLDSNNNPKSTTLKRTMKLILCLIKFRLLP